MASLDPILRIMVDKGATELRLPVGAPPSMSRQGEPLKLTFPPMNLATLRGLAGDMLSDARLAQAAEGGAALLYESPYLGLFSVQIQGAEDTLELVFHRGEELHELPEAEVLRPQVAVPSLRRRREPAQAASTPTLAPSAPGALAPSAPGSLAPPEATPAAVTPPATLAAPISVTPMNTGTALGPSEALRGLLQRALAAEASDLHLADGEAPALRVDGQLHPLSSAPPAQVSALLSGLLSAEAERALQAQGAADLAFSLESGARVRLNVYRFEGGLAAALRLLHRQAPDLASLHLPEALRELVAVERGLIIACGPTGSGKSTTLAALVQAALRRRGGLVVSLEDPIEYRLRPIHAGSLVRQRELGRDFPSFAAGLRAALREDPDVLLVGEMRDPESIALTLTAAETGHLVLASLHSGSAASAVERICDAFPPGRQQQIRVQLADCLSAVVGQRLLPSLSGGRLPVVEVLRVGHDTAKLIRQGRTEQLATALQGGGERGQLPFERHLAERVRAGEIDVHVARAAAAGSDSFEAYLRGGL